MAAPFSVRATGSSSSSTSVCVVKMSLGVPAVSVGDKFPTTPVVHVGFPKAKTIAELLEGKSKVLFVSLPGAFTPT